MKGIINKLNKYMEILDSQGYFNGAVLVEYKNEIIHCKGYGMANHQFNVQNTDDTKFRIGSLTKGFIAMSILQLVQDGLLQLNDTLDRYIEGFIEGHQITIHNMLIHSSGMQDYTSDVNYWPLKMRLQTTLADTINSCKERPLEFEPGTDFGYTSTEYIILAYIIQLVSGLTYDQYIEEKILKPLGMINTGFDDGRKIVKNLANGYTVWKNIINPEFVDMTITKGAYDMYSSVKDLNLWSKALRTEQLVSLNNLAKMFTNYNGVCGYGWFLDSEIINSKERSKFYHFGDINGYVNYFSRYIDDELTIIILSNLNLTPVEQMAKTIAKIIMVEDTPLPALRKVVNLEGDFKEYLGQYALEKADNYIELRCEEHKLYVIVTKMYGVKYMLEILPIRIEGSKVEFKTTFIDESIIIDKVNDKHFNLTYIDYYGKVTVASKLKD